MTYAGRYILGESVPLPLKTVNAAGTPTEPSDCPQVKIWRGATKVAEYEMPVIERAGQPGTFFLSLYLGPAYSAGSYLAEFRWVLGDAYIGAASTTFEVTAGGHADGSVVGMYFYERPGMTYVVHETERGVILPGKNAYV